MDIILVNVGSLLILAANIIWYRSKFILKRKGYQVGWVTRHSDDYPNLIYAIESEKNNAELRKLIIQKRLMLSIWVIYPLGAILILIGAIFIGAK